MNSYKFNSIAQTILLITLSDRLKIDRQYFYKYVKSISSDGIVTLFNDKQLKITLEEL